MAVAVAVAVGGGRRADGAISASAISEGGFAEGLGEVGRVAETSRLGAVGARRGGHTLECVVLLLDARHRKGRALGQGSADLVVGQIGLARVGEEGHHSGDPSRRPGLAGGDHDAEVDKVIVDGASAGLDDVDILATDRVLDLAATLTDLELAQDAVAGRDAQDVADVLDQLGVRVAAEDDNVLDHFVGCKWW